MDDRFAVASFCEAFQRTAAADPDAVALRTPGGALEITWREYAERVTRIAAGLSALGIRRGDTVALMMVNRPEFHLCDTGALHLGASAFSVYNTLPPEEIAHLLSNAGSRVVFCDAQFAERVLAVRERSPVEHVVCVDAEPDGTMGLGELEGRGDPAFDFEAAWTSVTLDDVLTLIYTSGTTGPPKGVELTHGSMLAQLRGIAAVASVRRGDRVISYLPLAHVADRFASHYMPMAVGTEVTCLADMRGVATVLREVRPDWFGAVPRVWEKLKAGIETRAAEAGAVRGRLTWWAFDAGMRKVHAEQAALRGEGAGPGLLLRASHGLAERLVLVKIREALGLDRTRWCLSGAAPVPIETLEFFAALGVPICEIFGMSELSGAGTFNPPDRSKLGTVGPALPGAELRVADDGELLVRGDMVMRGYRGEPEKTSEAIDADGWLHTGDIVEVDHEGYVKIVDRKKELIINAAGKNMSPANIEGRIKAAGRLIGQAIAIGDSRPYNVALVVLDPEAAGAHASRVGLGDGSSESVSYDAGVRELVAREIAAANEQLARVEQIKRFEILPGDWEPGGDELTVTMKLKRKEIAAKYAGVIEELYAGSRGVEPRRA